MALDFAAIDWSDPIPGYLPDAKMAGLADVTIRHSGLALPAHSYVLASQCPVLQDMLLSVAELSAGSKRKLSAMEQAPTIELATPFEVYTLQEVVLFLRFLYQPADITATRLEQAADHVPGSVRLAQRLDARSLLTAVDWALSAWMQQQQPALQWLPLAEDCGLDAAWAQGVRTLASEMLKGPAAEIAAILDGEKLRGLSQRALLALATAMAAGARATLSAPDGQQAAAAAAVPSCQTLAAWQGAGVQHAEFCWSIPGFLQLDTPAGEALRSPPFGPGGMWSVNVHPRGRGDYLGCAVSVALGCSPNSSASFKTFFKLGMDGISAQPPEVGELARDFTKGGHIYYGFAKFITRKDLEAQEGRFLPGGTATFHVSVSWLEVPAPDGQ